MKSQFQLVHNVSASGTVSDEGISYSANWYLTHYATQDSIIIEGNIGDRLEDWVRFPSGRKTGIAARLTRRDLTESRMEASISIWTKA